MKKLLIMALLLLLATPVLADTITFDNLTSFNDLTVPIYNNTLDKLYVKINTGIDGDNITNQTITSEDIATAVNPLVRDQENVGEYVYTGLTLPITGAASSGTITAGTAFVTKDDDSTLHRVVTATSSAITNFTGYTVNQDNWVYLDFAGNFAISATGIGAAQPADPANSIVLGYVTVDSGGDITTASEAARQTVPPAQRQYQDYIFGCLVSRDTSDTSVINLQRGEVDLGSSGGLRRNTTEIDIDFSVSGRSGLAAADTWTADTYYYLYTYPDPDNATNFEGIAGSTKDGVADVTNERLAGWCFSATTSVLSPDSVGAYKGRGSATPNIVQRTATTTVTKTGSGHDIIPGLDAKFYSSGSWVRATLNVPFESNNANSQSRFSISADSQTIVDSNTDVHEADRPTLLNLTGIIFLPEGEYAISGKWSTPDTLKSEPSVDGARRLIIEEL